jgi:hypothetical protein
MYHEIEDDFKMFDDDILRDGRVGMGMRMDGFSELMLKGSFQVVDQLSLLDQFNDQVGCGGGDEEDGPGCEE